MDKIVRALMADDTVKLIAISGRDLCEKARELHGLSRVCTAALGRTLLVTDMMGAQLKGEDHKLTAIVKGGGPAGNIVCTADNRGHVKGYVEQPALELPLGPDGKLDVSMAVGWFGDLTVVRDLGMKEPYVGKCDMVSGEIAEDFAQYFTVSEQQPSMVYLGVRVDPHDGHVLAGGGIIVQPLPHCPDEVIDTLTEKAVEVKMLAGMLEEGIELEDALRKIFGGIDINFTESLSPEFRCDCSRERLERVLISLGHDELKDMMEKEKGAELTCHFCNKTYSFTEDELEDLLKEAVKA
ncbi:MAG: Hsp33 family molecular chaperone HslO [Clostridia bacterium]|nr:Hsp33 family molecular chaperone HslO [Clostridia bacterium]